MQKMCWGEGVRARRGESESSAGREREGGPWNCGVRERGRIGKKRGGGRKGGHVKGDEAAS